MSQGCVPMCTAYVVMFTDPVEIKDVLKHRRFTYTEGARCLCFDQYSVSVSADSSPWARHYFTELKWLRSKCRVCCCFAVLTKYMSFIVITYIICFPSNSLKLISELIAVPLLINRNLDSWMYVCICLFNLSANLSTNIHICMYMHIHAFGIRHNAVPYSMILHAYRWSDH